MAMTALHFTDTEGANAILSSNPFALLVGMTLYQQVPVEKAFAGPAVIEEPTTTVVIPATYTATVDNERSYHLTRNDAGSEQAGGAR